MMVYRWKVWVVCSCSRSNRTDSGKQKAAYMRRSAAAQTGTLGVVLPRKIFGRNVARIRAELGITQERLCEQAEIDRSYLQRIESGASSPTVDIAARLKKALGCTWETLFEGID